MVSLVALSIVVLHLTGIVSFLVISAISRIFGAAKRKRPIYPAFYVTSLLLALGMLLSLLGLDLPTMGIAAAITDLVALVIGTYTTWFYWEWLPRELRKEKP